ncbi:MAG: SDR family oxidoreductase [Sphingobium sp.]|nr:SDR family oxidoreductase [Sphingobium sp.]
MNGCLPDKIAIVLGAAGRGNMGQVIARRLAREGARVVVAGRHLDVLALLADEIGGLAIVADITRRQDLDAMVATTVERFGRVDIAVQCTGVGIGGPFLDVTEADLAKLIDIQFKGPFQFMQAVIPAMTGGGSIIQISSATATIMLEDFAAYMGTKAGIDHVVRTVANEFGKRGIRANSISPGLTDTPMNAGAIATPGLLEAFLPSYPLGRIGTSEDVAAAVVYLASDECFVTGQNLQVNGGLTLRSNPTTAAMVAAMDAAAKAAD